jgi:type VI secretion system protein VasJ
VAEDTFRELPYYFLLDLQRFVVTAMDGLGAAYQPAKQVVLYETALFINRLPGVPRLAFINGMPFADPATQYWLEQTVEPVLASGSGAGPSAEDDKALAGQHDEAKKLFAEGDLGGALRVLQEGRQQDGSPRSRFRRHFYMAQLCMLGNQAALACSILENLDAEIEKYSLHAWEPALALEVWNHLYRCYDVLRGAEEGVQDGLDARARRVFGKISQVDVTQALKAGGH